MERNERPVLQMVGITKEYPGVRANDNIDFDVKEGEVHGLLGENGAGKTTLMKVLYGLQKQDSGEIFLNGDKVEISSPREANDLGIGMVHQHFMLVENLTALENIVLGLPLERPPLLELGPARARFEKLVNEYNLDLDPSTPVWQLPVGDAKGCSIVFISHKLSEMKQVADRVTVLRDGHTVGTIDPKEVTPTDLAKMMVGREVILDRRSRPPSEINQVVLSINDLTCENDRGFPALRDLNLNVYAGEIVGVAGVDGNGQKELAECISGLRQPTKGTICVNDELVTGVMHDPSLLGFVPQDRQKTGLILGFDVAENLILKKFMETPFTQKGVMRWRTIRREANKLIEEYNIMASNSMVPVRFLSGGNQQKVQLKACIKCYYEREIEEQQCSLYQLSCQRCWLSATALLFYSKGRLWMSWTVKSHPLN